MSVETIVAEVKAEAVKIEGEVVKAVAVAKADVIEFEGSLAAEIVKLKAAIAAVDQSALVKALESKVDALIAKIGVKL